MTKEEAKHMSEVLKAYSEGEIIQVKVDDYWSTDRFHGKFNLRPFNYRVLPEPKYRPYANAEEFLKAQKEHGLYLYDTTAKYLIYDFPYEVELKGVTIDGAKPTFKQLCDRYKWQDGTPCGIIEE